MIFSLPDLVIGHRGTIVRKKLHNNIKAVYALAFFHSFMVIVPVLVPFFNSKGLDLAEIFYLQALFAAVIVVLEAPSGYFADLFGRRTALVLGSAIHGLGYLYLNFADSLLQLAVFEITVGISMSLLSGADLAILYDSQAALKREENTEHSSGIAQLGFTKSCAEGLGALSGGVLALYSFDIMVLAQSAIAWACLAIALCLVEPPVHCEDHDRGKLRLAEVLRRLFLEDALLRRVVVAIPLYSLATFHMAWLVQPYWEQQGLSLALFGILWFTQSLTVALGSKFGFYVERRLGAGGSLTLIGLLPVFGYFGVALAPPAVGIGLALLLFICRGLSQVILVNALNRRVPSRMRATANSLTSFMFRLAFIITGPAVGFLADSYGLGHALSLLGWASVVLFVVVMMPLLQSVRGLLRAPA